jgi:hypothetical protein
MTITRGHGELKFTWKKDSVKRSAAIEGDFTEHELIEIFCSLSRIQQTPPDSWMEGYAAGRREGVNATRLEYAQKQKGGKK